MRRPRPRVVVAAAAALTAAACGLWLQRLPARIAHQAALVAHGRPYTVVDLHRASHPSLRGVSCAEVIEQAVAYTLWLPNDVEISGSSRFREMHFGLKFSATERYLWSFGEMRFVPVGAYLF